MFITQWITYLYTYRLEIVVFISGFIVLLFEIVGARMLGPYFGTSSVVWTSIISIILLSLAIGYVLGGKIADRKTDTRTLAYILFFASIILFLTVIIKDVLLSQIIHFIRDIRIGAIIASVLLFSPTSILLGMVSPYAIRLALSSLHTSGAVIGRLSALSTF